MAAGSGPALASFGLGRKSVAFGTAITVVAPPRRSGRTKVTKLAFTCAGTAHTLTALRELARTTVFADAAASASTFKITRDPGAYAANNLADGRKVTQTADNPIAASDIYIVRLPDNSLFLDTVSARTVNSDGTVTITPTATIPTGGFKAGATVWWFGVTTDTDPATGLAHLQWLGTASAQVILGPTEGGTVVESFYRDSPIVFSDNNATATGSIDFVSGEYTPS